MPKQTPALEAQRRIDRLRRLVEAAGRLADFARLNPGVDPSYVSQILNGYRTFGEKSARAMEEKCHLPRGYFDEIGNTDTIAKPIQQAPLISWVQAGAWADVVDNLTVGDFDELIATTVPVGRHTFALRVVGDSMTNPGMGPSFPEGSCIVVEPDLRAESGDFVVVRQNGDEEATFKQLVKDGGHWFLKPLNPRYPIMGMREDATVVGVVREVLMRLK